MEPETLIKQTLNDRYKIIEIIGKGGMATVYKAIQLNLNRPVALKIIHQNLVHDDELIKRFKREAQICSSINNSNIVTVYDVGSRGTVHYISMELLEGTTLRDLIKTKGKLSPYETVMYINPIAHVLGIIHDKGIVHRDVKSSNIFIAKDGRPVLMDFGVVYSEEKEPLSITGSILGTPEYMSPEQAEGKLKIDSRSDIYSLGVILFECLTGQLPFQSANYITTLYHILNFEPPQITSINPEIPQWLANVVMFCLKKDRESRIQNGYTLAKLLREEEKLKIPSKQLFNGEMYYKIKPAAKFYSHLPEWWKRFFSSPSDRSILMKSIILILALLIIVFLWIIIDPDFYQFKKKHYPGLNPVSESNGNLISTDSSITINSYENQNNFSNKELMVGIQNFMKSGEDFLEKGLYEEAIIQFQMARKLDQDNTVPIQRINETLNKWRRTIIVRANNHLVGNNYDSAIYLFNLYRKYDNSNLDINSRRRKAYEERMKYKEQTARIAKLASIEDKLKQTGIRMVRVESDTYGDFFIGESEVTQQLWEKIMNYNPSHFKGDMLPVDNVSIDEIKDFLSRLNRLLGTSLRLPSEKEWEWAASGGDKSKSYKYSGSNQLSKVAWYINNSNNSTHKVKNLDSNELGLFDMSGNVWEWCNASSNGNPVLKGGSWLSTNTACAIEFRQICPPDRKDNTIGFRLCMSE